MIPKVRMRQLSQCNPTKVKQLQAKIQKNIGTPRDGLPHFLMMMASYSIVLPPLPVLPEEFRDFVLDCIVDRHLLQMLVETKCINWCRTVRPLYPIKTSGDGNCLLHAVSIAMWGFHDSALFLRRLVYAAMVEDVPNNHIRKRWQQEKGYLNEMIPGGGLQLNSVEWDQEWDMVVKIAEDCRQNPMPNTLPYHPLEDIHIFTLANVLRRPIIIVCEPVIRDLHGSTMEPNNFGGIYLPLLWLPQDCIKSPLILGYDSSHFVPLVGVDDVNANLPLADKFINAVPLVTNNLQQLPVHFLLAEESGRVRFLLQDYLQVTEVTMTMSDTVAEILVARLDQVEIPDEYNIMKDFFHQLERLFLCGDEEGTSTTEQCGATLLSDMERNLQVNLPEKPEARLQCIEPDCKFYGTTETGGRCSQCFDKFMGASNASSSSRIQGITPTAPTQSIIMKNSEKPADLFLNSGEHAIRVTGSAGGEAYIPSMTGEECIMPGCQYIASQNVYPYCHMHAPLAQQNKTPPGTESMSANHKTKEDICRKKAKSSPGDIQLQRLRRSQKAASVAGEELRNNDLDSARFGAESMDDLQTRHSTRCKYDNCQNPGLPRWRSLCQQHYAYLTLPLEQEELPSKVPVNPTEPTSATIPRQTHSPVTEEPAVRNTTGSMTASTEHLMPTPTCKRHGCQVPANDHYHGFCTICFVSSDLRGQNEQEKGTKIAVPKGPEEMEYNQSCLTDRDNMNSIDILERLPHTDPREKAQAKVLHKCRKDSCPGAALEDAQGYCSWCVVSKYKNRELNLPKQTIEAMPAVDPQEEAWSVGGVKPVSSDHKEDKRKPCTTPGCEGVQCTNTCKLCVYCFKNSNEGKIPNYIIESQTVPERENQEDPLCGAPTASHPHQETWTQTGPLSPVDVELSSSGIQFLTSYDQQLNAIPLCAKPGCQNPGHDMQSGFCVECYNAACTETASLGAASNKIYTGSKEILALAPRCRREGCVMYGSEEYGGYCSKCGMQELDKGTFGGQQNLESSTEWKQSSTRAGFPVKMVVETVKMVEPPEKSLVSSKEDLKSAALCRNEQCTLYGDPCFDGFCSECHRRMHTGADVEPVEVSYSGGSPEYASMAIHTAHVPVQSQEKMTNSLAPEVHQCARIIIKTGEQPASAQSRSTHVITSQGVKSHYGHMTSPLPYQHIPTTQTQPPSISTIYREAAARIENQSRMSVSKCKMPSCTNYGHSSRQGYCNSCFVKVQQERFEKFDARTNKETS